MTKKYCILMALVAIICLMIGLAAGIVVGMKRGIPFVAQREQWTIGIYSGESPFVFDPDQNRGNPVLRAEDVTDVPAKFVADPFLMQEDSTWYLFFEVYNLSTQQGDLAVATSTDTRSWNYQQIILDEPFHLSYPYVFKWQGEYYLIPESFEANSIRLYKAADFPTRWTFVETLVEGRDFVDNSIVYFDNKWWLFAATTSNDTLHLYYADDLQGSWQEHPESPIVEQNNHIARPSGRVVIYQGRPYRYTMDVNPPNGTHQVWAFEITELTPTRYAEKRAGEVPVLKPHGTGWTARAMHQIDPHQIEPNRWIASVDGYGKYLVYGLQY
ncbi:MAG: hypothetical protein R3264_08845 [Anaerolineae bacterium]|nr:hypothetical protein [Anaerolineae bacterium]